MSADQSYLPEFDAIEIPDKRSFKIGEVAKLLDLEPYVLRYWEKEFDVLEPNKTESGQRSYESDDIQLLATIRKLLYTEMFTIDGARRQLQRAQKGEPSFLDAARDGGDVDGEEVERLREQNRELEREVESLADQNEAYAGRIEELEEEVERARSGAETDRELQEENDRLRRRLEEAESRVEELEAQCRALEQDASNRGDVLEELRSEISQLAAAADDATTARRSGV